jgi:TRAP-type C4-dicarboxylate transport system permease small subunit
MRHVVIRYVQAGCCVAVAVVAAFAVAYFINRARLSLLSDGFMRFLRLITATFFATAVLGRSGWDIQTWRGTSPAEKWNKKIFRVLYIFGFFLLVLSFLIRPV